MVYRTVVRSRIWYVIEELFSRSVVLGWNNNRDEVVIVHYFARDEMSDETFCCIRNVWWEFTAHDDGYKYDGDWVHQIEIDSLDRIEPPQGVRYSRTTTDCYGDEPFSPANRSHVLMLLQNDYGCQ